jgi:hypothetical protein
LGHLGGAGDLGGIWEPTASKHVCFTLQCLSMRPGVSRRRDERRCHCLPRLRTKVGGHPDREAREPCADPYSSKQFGEINLSKCTCPSNTILANRVPHILTNSVVNGVAKAALSNSLCGPFGCLLGPTSGDSRSILDNVLDLDGPGGSERT